MTSAGEIIWPVGRGDSGGAVGVLGWTSPGDGPSGILYQPERIKPVSRRPGAVGESQVHPAQIIPKRPGIIDGYSGTFPGFTP